MRTSLNSLIPIAKDPCPNTWPKTWFQVGVIFLSAYFVAIRRRQRPSSRLPFSSRCMMAWLTRRRSARRNWSYCFHHFFHVAQSCWPISPLSRPRTVGMPSTPTTSASPTWVVWSFGRNLNDFDEAHRTGRHHGLSGRGREGPRGIGRRWQIRQRRNWQVIFGCCDRLPLRGAQHDRKPKKKKSRFQVVVVAESAAVAKPISHPKRGGASVPHSERGTRCLQGPLTGRDAHHLDLMRGGLAFLYFVLRN
jgi:hypothetical protein